MTIFKFNQQITRTFVETGIINLSLSTQMNTNQTGLTPTTNGANKRIVTSERPTAPLPRPPRPPRTRTL